MNTLTINGETRTVGEWSRMYGISRITIYYRLGCGMSAIDAVTKPARINGKPLTFNGVTKLHSEWAKELGITKAALTARLKHYPLEQALTMPKRERTR